MNRNAVVRFTIAGMLLGVCAVSAYGAPKKKKDLDDLVKSAEALLDEGESGTPPSAKSAVVAPKNPPKNPTAAPSGKPGEPNSGVSGTPPKPVPAVSLDANPGPDAGLGIPDAPVDAPTDAPVDALVDAPTDAPVDAPVDAQVVYDAAPSVAAVAPVAAVPEPGATSKSASKSARRGGRSKPRASSSEARNARIESGANVELKGPEDSPLAALGVPPAAVPAVAAAATATALNLWPFIMKTLLGLLKGLAKAMLADKFKTRAKKDKAINTEQKTYTLAGLRIRPREVAQLALGATVYGAAVYYTMFGLTFNSSALARQESLVVMFYMIRTLLRSGFEAMSGIMTEFRFWAGGGVLCLGAAYLGNPLNTVGYELNSAQTQEEKDRLYRLTLTSMAVTIGLAVIFFAMNRTMPHPFFQAGMIACTGGALSDTLPVAPMSGKKIWDTSKWHWLAFAAIVFPMFFLFNFVL